MKFHTVSPNDLTISEFHNKKMTVSYQNKPLRVQLPKMYMQFGVGAWGQPARHWIDFNIHEDGGTKKYHDWVKAIEHKVISKIEADSGAIFGTPRTYDWIAERFNSSIKVKPPYPSKFRAKVETQWGEEDVPKADFWDPKGLPMNNLMMKEGLFSAMSATPIVELSSIYFMKSKGEEMIGITWKLVQMKLIEPKVESVVSDYQFIEDED